MQLTVPIIIELLKSRSLRVSEPMFLRCSTNAPYVVSVLIRKASISAQDCDVLNYGKITIKDSLYTTLTKFLVTFQSNLRHAATGTLMKNALSHITSSACCIL